MKIQSTEDISGFDGVEDWNEQLKKNGSKLIDDLIADKNYITYENRTEVKPLPASQRYNWNDSI